jgi:mitogen-activated protein kinase kinase
MDDRFTSRSLKRRNVKDLTLAPAAPKPPPTAEGGHMAAGNDGHTAHLEIGIEYKLDLRPEELESLKEIGSGNGGTVSKVRHIPSNTVMARKV